MFIEELTEDQYQELGQILVNVEAKSKNYEISSIVSIGAEISFHQPWVLRIGCFYRTKNGKSAFVDFDVEDYFCTVFYPANYNCTVNEPETTKAVRKYFTKLFKKEYTEELNRELAELGEEI